MMKVFDPSYNTVERLTDTQRFDRGATMVVFGLLGEESVFLERSPLAQCGVEVERRRRWALRRSAERSSAERARRLKPEETEVDIEGEPAMMSPSESVALLASLASERRRRQEKAFARQERLRSVIRNLATESRDRNDERVRNIASRLNATTEVTEETERFMDSAKAELGAASQETQNVLQEAIEHVENLKKKEQQDALREQEKAAERQKTPQEVPQPQTPQQKPPAPPQQQQPQKQQQPPPQQQQQPPPQQQPQKQQPQPPQQPPQESQDVESEVRNAFEEAKRVSGALEAQSELKRSALRTLKKVVGSAVNSIQNDRSSVKVATETLKEALTDPRGLQKGGPQTTARRNPFGGGGGATPQTGKSLLPLKSEQVAILEHFRIDDNALFFYVAYHVCDRILERVLDDTFDRKRDVWGLAGLVAFLLREVPSLRRIFQGSLLGVSLATVAKPGGSLTKAERVAALLAAASAGFDDDDSPFGGLPAAWTWLARYANCLAHHQDPVAALPPLIAFLDNSAFALSPAFQQHFTTLLATLLRWFKTKEAFHGAAAVKLQDINDHLNRGIPFDIPTGLQTYRSS